MVDELVGPEFENKQCADKRRNTVRDDFAVDHVARVKGCKDKLRRIGEVQEAGTRTPRGCQWTIACNGVFLLLLFWKSIHA